MSDTIKDLAFFADVLSKISRTEAATQYIDQLVEAKPQLEQSEYELFGFVYKTAIDPIRHTLQSLMSFYDSEVDQRHALRAESIQVEKEKSHRQFASICHHVIDMITSTLLPNAIDQKATIFFNKTLGDYYRYLAEFERSEEAKRVIGEAKKAYSKALEVCDSNLLPCDPLRLGVLLNFAIFKHEHLMETSEASALLQEARNEAELELGQLSQNSQNEALEILQAMRTNLIVWSDDEDDNGENN
ncbi:14-3-3-like protein D [Tritrichomonas foetus]|uniref:14-3-3-like protein D n=1 Tax=Tritrichomonas foetus TaxID=1144522 RepID=A0A1J4J7C5_9EUKA|nr:14-3-3-like protein D [Tritrichomonas foetus]|eukprot:OHS95048.1 14-3-3-like protein D [Tritrichomonas foetus]